MDLSHTLFILPVHHQSQQFSTPLLNNELNEAERTFSDVCCHRRQAFRHQNPALPYQFFPSGQFAIQSLYTSSYTDTCWLFSTFTFCYEKRTSVCLHNGCTHMRLLLRTFQSFLVLAIGETNRHRTQKEEKLKKEDEALPCLKFINIYTFIYDRKEEEQLILPRIITPAFSRMDPGRQEGAFLQVISLDC